MKRVIQFVLLAACCGSAAALLHAQAPTDSSQNKPADAQKPSAPQGSNPFPEDTTSVPVLPSRSSPGTPPPALDGASYGNFHVPSVDSDPVRSPDDPASDAGTSDQGGFSSSQQGLDQMIQPPPDNGKHGKKQGETMPHAGPKEDVHVGNYYLQTGDWRGALSRFESALVLAPDNPDVYWGLAEAQRHLGNYPAAKANYLKVMEYDPDSRHSKAARKILKQPEMANANAARQPQ